MDDCGAKSFFEMGVKALGAWDIPEVIKELFCGVKSADTEVGSSVSLLKNSFSSSERARFPKINSFSKSRYKQSVDFKDSFLRALMETDSPYFKSNSF